MFRRSPRPKAEASTSKLAVLCLHGATTPPLGADTWVHAQIIDNLDRATHDLHVAYVPDRDGSPTPTATALAKIDDLQRVTVNLGRERVAEGDTVGLKAKAADAAAAARSMGRLIRHVRANQISVIHTSDRPRDALVSVVLAKLTGARSIVHVHVIYGEWMGRALTWSLRNADERIAVSEFVARSLAEAGIDGPTHVVLNAIDLDRWQPGTGREQIRAELGAGPDVPVVITVCRLFAEKGVAELITAIAEVRESRPDVRLVIVGKDGSEGEVFRQELDRLVEQHGLQETVHFTGRRSDVPELMAAADIFAMPSFEEPFGLVFAEAMAMELPVVGLDNGGTPEVVTHGEHGLLSEPGDHDALVSNLQTLLGDRDLCTKFGAAGRRHVEERFRVERLAADTAAAYRHLDPQT